MSLFRKPKKIQRRVFSSTLDEEEDASSGVSGGGASTKDARKPNDCEMDVDGNDEMVAPPPPQISVKVEKKKSKESTKLKSSSAGNKKDGGGGDLGKSKALLSFADEGNFLYEK